MAHWATAPLNRQQVALFYPTLDDSLAAAHPVRLLEETLRELDFSAREALYVLVAGQPPIHPRLLAKEKGAKEKGTSLISGDVPPLRSSLELA